MRSISIAAFALLVLVGCSPQAPAPAPGSGGSGVPTAATPGAKLKIGVSLPAADHGWTGGALWWAKQAMDMHNDEVEWILSTADKPEKQISDVEAMMAKKIDCLVILCTESAPLTPIAKKAHDAGILVVNVDRGFTEPAADVFIEGDNKAFGRKSAEYIVQKLGGKGKIVVLEGIPCTVNTDRVEAAKAVFAANPGIQIVAQQSGRWNREASLKVMEAIVQKNPEIDCVWASDDDMALGAEQALKEANRLDKTWILGGAGMKDIVKRVMDGDKTYPADITYPPSMTATAVHMAVSILRNGGREKVMKFMPRHMFIDVDLITPENAKQYYFPESVF